MGAINPKSTAQVKQVLGWFEAAAVTAPVENALIITTAGEIYHCTGDLNTLDSIVELGDKLRGSIVTHNHPLGSANEYSFSDSDLKLFKDYELAVLRGVDERFAYEFNRNPDDVDANDFTLDDVLGDTLGLLSRHIRVIEQAKTEKFGYRRRER